MLASYLVPHSCSPAFLCPSSVVSVVPAVFCKPRMLQAAYRRQIQCRRSRGVTVVRNSFFHRILTSWYSYLSSRRKIYAVLVSFLHDALSRCCLLHNDILLLCEISNTAFTVPLAGSSLYHTTQCTGFCCRDTVICCHDVSFVQSLWYAAHMFAVCCFITHVALCWLMLFVDWWYCRLSVSKREICM